MTCHCSLGAVGRKEEQTDVASCRRGATRSGAAARRGKSGITHYSRPSTLEETAAYRRLERTAQDKVGGAPGWLSSQLTRRGGDLHPGA
jgi:hypothetical protein